MTMPSPFLTPVQPDPTQALAFFKAIFPASGCVHMRAVPEPKEDGRRPSNHHYMLDENFPDTLAKFLEYCSIESRAAFFLPGLTVPGKTHKDAVVSLPCFLVDFDKGNPDESLAKAEALIGPASVVVESGGSTESGPKIHAYWKLRTPATHDDIAKVCAIRGKLAENFGGDPSFRQEAQVIRIPGSIWFKTGTRLVKLRTIRPEAIYELSRISDTLKLEAPIPEREQSAGYDFNNVLLFPSGSVDRVMTQTIHEGAVDDMTRFEGAGKAIGHFIRMVREGRYRDLDEAWEAVKGWNKATLCPPWEESRLRVDFDRLVKQDIAEKGVIVPVVSALATQQAAGWNVLDWRGDRFQGAAPVRRWLAEGLIPLATPGVFAAVGDAGKSMLALRLALFVSSYPAADPLNLSCPRFFGCPVTARGAAVVLTSEDDSDEVHRRLNLLDPTNARKERPLYVVPMISAGGARAILSEGPNGPQPTPFWSTLREQLLAIPELKLVILDPLSHFVAADTNDNTSMSAVMGLLAELAATTGATVMLVHHFAKATTPTSLSDARTAIRGAGALVDNGRWALTLWEADQEQADAALKALDQVHRSNEAGIVYFGGLAKGNAPSAKILRTLVRGPSGVLEDMTDVISQGIPRLDEITGVVLSVLRAERDRDPRFAFTIKRTQLATRVVPLLKAAGSDYGISETMVAIDELLKRRLLVSEGGRSDRYVPVME